MSKSERAILETDLARKQNHLFTMHDQPALFVANYFFEIRNAIDISTERLLHDLSRSGGDGENIKDDSSRLNVVREEFVELLKTQEARALQERTAKTDKSSSEVYASIVKRVDDFKRAAIDDSMDVLQDAYLALALDIIEETNQLERRLLGEQTIVYLPSIKDDKFGNLVFLAEDYFNAHEIDCLRLIAKRKRKLKDMHLAIESSLNRSLVVGVTRPFIVTKNMLILDWLGSVLSPKLMVDAEIIRFDRSLENYSEFLERNEGLRDLVANRYETFDFNLKDESIDGFETTPDAFKRFRVQKRVLDARKNRLRSLDSQLLPLFEPLEQLDLSTNALESLNEDLLAKCVNLKSLRMIQTCLIDAKFSIGFVASLSNLTCLEITLPDMPYDFDVFRHLTKLTQLGLDRAPIMDPDAMEYKLTKETLMKLTELSDLQKLAFSNFVIETLDRDILGGFSKFTKLRFAQNVINHIHPDTFKQHPAQFVLVEVLRNKFIDLPDGLFSECSVEYVDFIQDGATRLDENTFKGTKNLHSLIMGNNKFEHVTIGTELDNLRRLHLGYNKIPRISRDMFVSKLASLRELYLMYNPIETIEAGAFSSLESVIFAFLEGCNLSSISNQTFAGMPMLNRLDLSKNQISSINVIEGDKEISTAKANLTSEELSFVKQNLFCQLKFLMTLMLSGNKIEKIDLNCLCNLSMLRDLDLSNNLINELNERAAPGTLEGLKSLNLSGNQLTFISENAFSNSLELETLDLSRNKLERLSEDFFTFYTYLRVLNLSDNLLTITISWETFRGDQLKDIDLLNNKEVIIQDGAFGSKLKSLKLDLSTSFGDLSEQRKERTHEMDDDDDNEMYGNETDEDEMEADGVKFKKLSLQKSDPGTLEHFFQDTSNQYAFSTVENLSLINSHIQNLSGLGLGERFTSLRTLSLSKNQITTIEPTWWDGLPSLKQLDLSGNLVEALDEPDLFQKVPNLTEINLSGNQLKRIGRRTLNGLFFLASLNLSNNQLSNVDPSSFRGLISLTKLNLDGNQLGCYDLSKLLKTCSRLLHLSLCNNQLDHESVNEAAMNNNIFLTELQLADNRLEHSNFTRNLTRLENINMRNNKIKMTSQEHGLELITLKSLIRWDFTGNQIA